MGTADLPSKDLVKDGVPLHPVLLLLMGATRLVQKPDTADCHHNQ